VTLLGLSQRRSLGHCRRSRRGGLRGWLGEERDWAKGLEWEERELWHFWNWALMTLETVGIIN
jgi:hypothetical protein